MEVYHLSLQFVFLALNISNGKTQKELSKKKRYNYTTKLFNQLE
jgi:hypothetical protein